MLVTKPYEAENNLQLCSAELLLKICPCFFYLEEYTRAELHRTLSILTELLQKRYQESHAATFTVGRKLPFREVSFKRI